MSAGDRLIELRADRSRKEVADALGITTQMLGAVERGARTPSLALAKKIALHYGVPLDNIFGASSQCAQGEMAATAESADEA